jgi:Transposase DDE domain
MAMTHADLIDHDWNLAVEQLGGAVLLEAEARETKAFERPREIKCGVDLLRFILAYCLGKFGLRLTAAWADGIGLASISNVALLGRLRNAVPWLERIAARLLVLQAEERSLAGIAAAKGRLIRIIDATNVVKAGRTERESGGVWRIHAAYDLPTERLSAFQISDEKGAEAINRIAVVPGEIRIGDRIHCRVEDLADVTAQGGDIIVRAGWRAARWTGESGQPFDIIGALQADTTGLIDWPIWLARDKAQPLPMRLVAIRMPKDKAMKAVAEARAGSRNKGSKLNPKTLVAAEWVIIVTSLAPAAFSADEVIELYRLRWRIEIAFKRMKSLIGLRPPPGKCAQVAKVWVLCHLIAVLLTEAQLSAIGDSPRRAPAPGPACGAQPAC